MKPEHLDNSSAAEEKAENTVLEILRMSKVKLASDRFFISVFEPEMPGVIKCLHKSGFYRTTSKTYSTGHQTLMLRRSNIVVEIDLPRVKYGADVLVKKLQKSGKLALKPMSLSKEGVIARTQEDSLIDISYTSMLAIYEEVEKLNAWRNSMQFTLPDNGQIVALIHLLDRCLEQRETGSAVDYDKYDVRWGEISRSKSTGAARITYVPSSGRYEVDVKVDGFSWNITGNEFNYLETASNLKLHVERQMVAPGDPSPHQWLTQFHERMLWQFRDMSAPHYEETKHLV